MKRFYKIAAADSAAGDSARVLLDGRPLKTPAKTEMRLPTLALAEAIAAEWEAQQADIKPETMPLTRLAATAIDRVTENPAFATDEIVRYGDTDLLSYRATEPSELVILQHEAWQPLLDWFRARYDMELAVTSGIMAVAQPVKLQSRLRQVCEACDPFTLTALQAATTNTGSVVLGLALLNGRVDAHTAWKTGLLDELYQVGLWGEDTEAAHRRANLAADLEAIARFLLLLQVTP